ncbi:23S rRNA (pseudouridine(1915)-N(3))-methyltransferase RlmH [Granulicella paludicola]|uniref:23S rRNA (pseudouridine(1915)-N(3))-methyltransferase RlmH n=1 Tax=Granulicella paludicola TaxID=474951 RepID=UPI0021E0B764|nr:23S rRNA (pseudouridine(1915)-N(3))-methyltransferase RlmH [Granulicella paludicola]
MKILLSAISASRPNARGSFAPLIEEYVKRSARYAQTSYRSFSLEADLLGFLQESATRTRPHLLLADSQGQQLSSPELAALLGQQFDAGTQTLIFAIGPADGWSAAARKRADKLVAFGRITLPHELAAVVAAEQLYRALTIRAGHPYHSGH